MKLSVLPAVIVVAFVLPTITIYRSAEAYPMELSETDDESTEEYNPSWQIGQLLDKFDEVDAHRREEALENLQKMFGIRTQIEKKSTRHKTPPQFMMELYKTIADPSGVTRGKNPYNAKIVRSFIERDSWLSHLYLFNISGLEINESVLEAELHLYRKRTSLKVTHPTILSSPYYLIRVYQVLEGKRIDEPDLHRLLNVHYVGAHASGWQVFNVKQAVLAWVSGAPNLGLIVTASTLFGDEVSIEFSRRNDYHHSKQPILVLFDDDDGKVREVGDNIVQHYYSYDNEPEETEVAPSSVNGDRDAEEENADAMEESVNRENPRRLKRHRDSAVDEATNNAWKRSQLNREESYGTQLGNNMPDDATEYLQRQKRISRKRSLEDDEISAYASRRVDEDNEGRVTRELASNSPRPRREAFADGKAINRPKSKKFVSERRTRAPEVLASMDIYERAMLREQTRPKEPRYVGRQKDRARGGPREKRLAGDSLDVAEEESKSHANTRENTTECGRHELYVDFKEIGLSSSIIAPKGYSAYHCQGPCESPLSQDQQPTNHATVQGIVHKMGLVNDVHMPCCVPTKLLSTTILFFDDNENVVLKVYEDMIADRCGCR